MYMDSESIKTIEYDNYYASAYRRLNLNKYSNHPFAVRFVKRTPKAKHTPEKTIKHYVYKSIEEAETAAKNWIDTIRANSETRKEELAKRRKANSEVKASDFYKRGDIIVNTWGYEQTNVDFYIVQKVGNRTIEIAELYQSRVEGSMYQHGMACMVTPGTLNPNGDKYTLRVYREGQLSNPSSYYYMHKWNGRPEYCSWYA